LKELEDYRWFPSIVRNFQLDFIGFVVTRFGVYDVFVQYLQTIKTSNNTMTDLCSGSGEPAISIFRDSGCFGRLLLSDKFPNDFISVDNRVTYEKRSTDVLDMEFKRGIYYTMFNAFHHFADEDKIKIIQKIRFSGSGGSIVEILQPTLLCLLKVIFTTTFCSLILTPFIHPFSFKRILLTYLFPVNILAITFDGIVSVFKSKSLNHYQNLFANHGDAIKIFQLNNRLSSLIIIQIMPDK
jgi:hypothetical protein